MPSRTQSIVTGVAEHAGWAILVSAAAVDGAPVVVDRRRVRLIEEGVPTQPYHHETLALPDGDAERLVRRVRQSIAACTADALDHLSRDLQPGYRVQAVAMREPTLDRLPATAKEAHDSYHVQCRADGMLYHSAVCAAAQQRGWKVVFHRRGEELQKAAEALQASTDDVERLLDGVRRTLKPPWASDHRHAFAAAIAALGEHSRFRSLSRRVGATDR